MPAYKPAPDVEAIANDLMRQYRPELIRLACPFRFLFCDDPEKVKGREALGTARVKTGMDAYLIMQEAGMVDGFTEGQPIFVITIWEDGWLHMLPSDHQKRALVHHELEHCFAEEDEKTGKVVMKTVGHDLEEFNSVIKLYGEWEPSIKSFKKALAQGPQLSLEEISGIPDGAVMRMPPVPRDTGIDSITFETRNQSVALTADSVGVLKDAAQRMRKSAK